MSTLSAMDTEIINIARSIRVYAMKANCDLPVGDPSDRDLDRVLFHQRQSLEKLTGAVQSILFEMASIPTYDSLRLLLRWPRDDAARNRVENMLATVHANGTDGAVALSMAANAATCLSEDEDGIEAHWSARCPTYKAVADLLYSAGVSAASRNWSPFQRYCEKLLPLLKECPCPELRKPFAVIRTHISRSITLFDVMVEVRPD